MSISTVQQAALASAIASDTGVLFASTAAVIAQALAFVILIERAGSTT